MKDVGLAAARFERAMIAARTKAALGVKKSRGESTGTPPYGLRLGEDGKTLVSDEHEQHVLTAVRGLREKGLSFRAVVSEATRLGFVGRTGMPFTLAATFRMTAAVEGGSSAPSQSSSAMRCRCPRAAKAKAPRACSWQAAAPAGVAGD